MSTINRFNKFTARDYSMKWHMPEIFTPNFEAWDSMLASQQQRYNAAMAASQKYPKHLEWRGDLAGQYKQNVESNVQDISNTFINEGVRAGNRKMRDFAFQLNQQWNPGGLAHELEKEYEDYQAGVKQISDYYEKNKAENSANRVYSLHNLKKDAQGEFKHDPTTGLYARAAIVPNLVPYTDIADEAFKVAKEIKESGRTDIIQKSPEWFLKIQQEGVTEKTVREVTEALLEQPKFAQQLQVEKWLIDQNTTPDQKQQMVAGAHAQVLKNKDNITKQISSILSSGKTDDIKSLQKQLSESGYYTGKIDGSKNDALNTAIEQYKADLQAKADTTIKNTSYDSLVKDQMVSSYTKPLIKAFAYEKINKDLIFNKAWETRMRISASRQDTLDLVTAIQSLRNPEQSEYLVTPGLGSPMDALSNIKKKQQEALTNAEKGFNQIVQLSGVGKSLGTTAPNKINEVMNARTQSKDSEEFKQRMIGMGYTPEQGKSAWDFFNSPAASDLQNSYLSMQDARQMVDVSTKAEASMVENFLKTPEGKKEFERIKKQFPNSKMTDAQFAREIASGSLTIDSGGSGWTLGYGSASPRSSVTNLGDEFKTKMNKYYKNKPEAVPESLRGYAFNAIKGAGSELEKVIFDDLKSGHTLGYSADGQAGIPFKVIGSNSSVDQGDVEITDMRFDVNASGVTYYLTGKSKEGKAVSAVVNAPSTHAPKLRQIALDMKKEAKDGNDPGLDAIANQLYAVTTEGPRFQNAVEDALSLNNKNTRQLNEVLDIDNSFGDVRRTFGTNANIKGTEVGNPKIVGGKSYQKYKVYNPNTGRSGYMLTIQTDGGRVPVRNSNGGLFFETSQEAESPIWNEVLMSQLPVDIDQKKVSQTNLTPEQATMLMTGAARIVQQKNNDNDDE